MVAFFAIHVTFFLFFHQTSKKTTTFTVAFFAVHVTFFLDHVLLSPTALVTDWIDKRDHP